MVCLEADVVGTSYSGLSRHAASKRDGRGGRCDDACWRHWYVGGFQDAQRGVCVQQVYQKCVILTETYSSARRVFTRATALHTYRSHAFSDSLAYLPFACI